MFEEIQPIGDYRPVEGRIDYVGEKMSYDGGNVLKMGSELYRGTVPIDDVVRAIPKLQEYARSGRSEGTVVVDTEEAVVHAGRVRNSGQKQIKVNIHDPQTSEGRYTYFDYLMELFEEC